MSWRDGLPGGLRRGLLALAILAMSCLALLLILDRGRPLQIGLAGLALSSLALLALPRRPRSRIQLRRAEKQEPASDFRLALDALPVPTVLVDRRAVVTYANRIAGETFTGLRKGFPFSAAFRDPDVLAALDRVVRARRGETVEMILPVPVERSFTVAILPLVGGERGEGGAAVLHLTETTQSRQVERMRADFVANASHELRTPLATILGFVETLQGAARDDATARERFLAIIATQARRMSRLIHDLLSLSRLELTAHIVPSEAVDLRLLVPHVMDLLAGSAEERGVALQSRLSAEGELVVKGDRDELIRLIENLTENAIKYGASGGRVEIGVDRSDEHIRLSVRDYGAGIAPEHLPRLTERFYRVNTSESREQGGTGLGLAICKHIVTRHRGRLEIESRPGEGTHVSVLLPGFGTH